VHDAFGVNAEVLISEGRRASTIEVFLDRAARRNGVKMDGKNDGSC
jgi:hypothetical protein